MRINKRCDFLLHLLSYVNNFHEFRPTLDDTTYDEQEGIANDINEILQHEIGRKTSAMIMMTMISDFPSPCFILRQKLDLNSFMKNEKMEKKEQKVNLVMREIN